MSYDETDDIVDAMREAARNEREGLAEFAHPETPLLCERCDEPSLTALCVRCDPDRWGLFEENRDRWTV